ncbi:hypothetical protein SAMN04487958_102216 [Vreelandella subterranea]|uniref:Uncharacterized protein n=1 Tax=Vreelandella subterranea TaxID=416874 RepID=A0A1H9R593_9GAMM|nr:hypothetical protein SAMN04487958_102216 [Halomonas subterranea]
MVTNTGIIESIQFVGCRPVITVRPTNSHDLRPMAFIGDGAFFVGTPAAVHPIDYFHPICPGEPS